MTSILPVFVDTNVLIYAADASDGTKHRVARSVLRELGPHRIAVSGQVLAEYANVLTHPRRYARGGLDVAVDVERMGRAWLVLALDAGTVSAALRARERWGLAYYDAQIWASAAVAGITTVLSEDFASGATLGGVTFVDPFAPGFEAAGT